MFFTHTIVGSALSVPLGNGFTRATSGQSGLQVNMRNASTSIDEVWKDWVLLQGAYPYVGRPRRAQGSVRRSLERHALLIASLAVLALAGAVIAIAVIFGLPIWNV